MPVLPVRWFVVLVALFAVAFGLDSWFAHSGARRSSAAREQRIELAAFLRAAAAGELTAGSIVYRANNTGLADLHARRAGPDEAGVRATARLTEADIVMLREKHFAEDDPASFAAARTLTAQERTAMIIHGAVHPLGLIALLAGIFFVVQRYAGRFTAFSSQRLRPVTSQVSFSAVAGCDEAKDEVYEVVEFLRDPARFRKTGGRMPKGVLLVGPPGTGKTMLAKAVAGEAQAHFYNLSGSDFVELYVGVGASRVRSLFKKARETAPSIIFIDEIDAIGRQRSAGESGGGAQQEHDQTLNALLVAMDGFDSDDAVVVFGATNRPDTIDRALLRPGRFDRQVSVGLPDLRGRLAILQVHAGGVKLDASVDLQEVAKATPGFSGADLANLLNEGAIHAARHRRATILLSDLDEARDKINWGRETRRVMTPHDKRVIAYHEAGHALMQVVSGEDAIKLQKVTIIPRGRSLGSTHFTPERDLFNYSQDQLVAKLRCLMAGRIAEELALGSITSGASGDIQEATKTARQMVFEWGMSPLGFMALSRPNGEEPFASPQTFHEGERHVRALLDDNYAATKAALCAHRGALDAIAAELIERETILGEDVRKIIAQQRSDMACS